MKRIFLLLFILPIIVSCALSWGLNFSSGFYYVSPVFTYGSIVGVFIGLMIYMRLWQSTNNDSLKLKPSSSIYFWLVMIISFFLIPTIYQIQENIFSKQNEKERIIYIQKNCKIKENITTNGHTNKTLTCPDGIRSISNDTKTVEDYIKNYCTNSSC